MADKFKIVRSPIVEDAELPETHEHNDIDQPAIAVSDLPAGTDHATLSNVTTDQHHARDHASRHAPGGGDALSLTSANMASIVTDKTGSGLLVFATSPTLTTPVLGAASATSLTLTTDLAVTEGGTGASTAADARTNLSVASRALDNLASVAINASLVSDTDSTDNLGSTTVAWANLYVDTISSITGNALALTPISGQSLTVNLATTGDFIVNTDDLVVDTSAGRVGIGTATPARPLNVSGDIPARFDNNGASSNDIIELYRGGVANFAFNYDTVTFSIRDITNDTKPFQIEPNTATNTLYLDSTGRVGIGTASPSKALHLAGAGLITGVVSSELSYSDINVGLVLHYPFSENTGTTTSDRSSQVNDATITGASWTSGKIGYGLNFDGTDDFVESTTPTAAFDVSSVADWTISALVNFDVVTGAGCIVAVVDDSSNFIYLTRDGTEVEWRVDKTGNTTRRQKTNGAGLVASSWYHILLTKVGNNDVTVYINGIANTTRQAQAADTAPNVSNTTLVGRMKTADVSYFLDGVIDEVKILTRALSADEVTYLTRQVLGSGIPLTVNSFSTTGYSHFGTGTASFGQGSGGSISQSIIEVQHNMSASGGGHAVGILSNPTRTVGTSAGIFHVGLWGGAPIDVNGTVSNAASIRAADPTVAGGGTITNNYGLYVENITSATNDYGIYIVGADTYAIWVDAGTTRLDGLLEIGNPVIHSLGITGAVVFNEQGADIDFRGESDDATDLWFFDAGADTGAGGIGFFSVTPQIQQATIADADGTLADITTKFNTLLADLEGYGLLKSV